MSLPFLPGSRTPLLLTGALLLTLACRGSGGGVISCTVDLRQAEAGVIPVRIQFAVRSGSPIVLESFAPKEDLRISSVSASMEGSPLKVEALRGAGRFASWRIEAPRRGGRVAVEYAVRPGAVQEARNAGPTGYRLGYLDRNFGLFSGRQIFLLPSPSSLPETFRVRFLSREGTEVVAPWSRGAGENLFEIQGVDRETEILGATIASGSFETAASPEGLFRVHLARSLPSGIRAAAIRRALDLWADLAARLGCARAYQLILVPKAPDGMPILAAPGPSGQGLSLGEGIPTRWMEIGRALGRSCLGLDRPDVPVPAWEAWFLEGLPVFLTLLHSDREGWRPRREWLEQFYFETAGIDLRRPGSSEDPQQREERGALVLDRLSTELGRRGRPAVEDSCGRLLADPKKRGERVARYLGSDLPAGLREDLARWLSPAPASVPFPGTEAGSPPISLSLPPSIPAGASREARVDLYLGGRNLGLLEQCGCRSKQVGGFARRTTLLKGRLRRGPPALALELGDAVPFDAASPILDRQKEAESDLSLALLAGSGTRASVVGYAEMAYGRRFLEARAARLRRGFDLLSVNVGGEGLALPPDLRVKTPRALLRIFGAADPASYSLGRPLEFEDSVSDLRLRDPAEALAGKLERERGPELLAVAGPLGPSSVLRIQKRFPQIDLILTDDSFRFDRDPRLVLQQPPGVKFARFGRLGGTLVVVLRSDSYALVRLGLLLDADGRIAGAELQDLPLDESIPDDPGVRSVLDRHYAALAAESGLSPAIPVGSRLERLLEADYIGEEACAACHSEEARAWSSTPHAAAFASILERRRQGVPACAACHVTGYGQPTGYRRIEDVRLRHVQCESCHGPGSRHVALPVKGSILRVPEEKDCLECHDPKHSEMNDATFPDYWARIVHGDGTAP